MHKQVGLLLSLFILIGLFNVKAQKSISDAKWITTHDANVDEPNRWIAYRKDFKIINKPDKAIAKISADSKYWLWINGELVVFEGNLKRGPNPKDTYADEVDITPYLWKGENKIAILLWHFGKEGFSHKNSGKAGLIFHLDDQYVKLVSDNSWLCKIHPAFGDTGDPHPNFRLPESNIRFYAEKDMDNWQTADCKSKFGFEQAKEIGGWGDAPWNRLVKRPIPMWKDYGIKPIKKYDIRKGSEVDTIIARLPYNMQMTPVLDLSDNEGGKLIGICTDHLYMGSDVSVRAEYVTKKGKQSYESLGWQSGHKLILTVPHGVSINKISYRETGYDAEQSGYFRCDNDFYMRFWDKALRTLYINMRDTYFDCPERERAQWWGDAVVLIGESFYTYSPSVHALSRKAIRELIGWQKEDGVLHSPIPEGNYGTELPGQMLAAIGHYGFWNYYMNTGDKNTIEEVYPGVKRYLALWSTDETGLTAFRPGGWTWGDWGDNRDIRLIFAGWHYLALKGAVEMAELLGKDTEAKEYKAIMERVKQGYNKCWNGNAYRHPDYKEQTDDRVQALAVISGIADESKYSKITEFLKTEFHASPYMEKYVMEALFVMRESEYAMERTQKRFSHMVNHPDYTTLFEGWVVGSFGGGTVNHAWSGGPLTVIGQYLCGIYPLEAGYDVFKIEPQPALLKQAAIGVPSIKGMIESEYKQTDKEFILNITVPKQTEAVIYLPVQEGKTLKINGKVPNSGQYKVNEKYLHKNKQAYQLPAGKYKINVK
ncbi:MAG: glycoside hydrolase [Prevotella sp.]|jgi:hypothetical protein|nr:glycoside hydrolase [Prevotella sp.]